LAARRAPFRVAPRRQVPRNGGAPPALHGRSTGAPPVRHHFPPFGRTWGAEGPWRLAAPRSGSRLGDKSRVTAALHRRSTGAPPVSSLRSDVGSRRSLAARRAPFRVAPRRQVPRNGGAPPALHRRSTGAPPVRHRFPPFGRTWGAEGPWRLAAPRSGSRLGDKSRVAAALHRRATGFLPSVGRGEQEGLGGSPRSDGEVPIDWTARASDPAARQRPACAPRGPGRACMIVGPR
jgi:hypothetical protein